MALALAKLSRQLWFYIEERRSQQNYTKLAVLINAYGDRWPCLDEMNLATYLRAGERARKIEPGEDHSRCRNQY